MDNLNTHRRSRSCSDFLKMSVTPIKRNYEEMAKFQKDLKKTKIKEKHRKYKAPVENEKSKRFLNEIDFIRRVLNRDSLCLLPVSKVKGTRSNDIMDQIRNDKHSMRKSSLHIRLTKPESPVFPSNMCEDESSQYSSNLLSNTMTNRLYALRKGTSLWMTAKEKRQGRSRLLPTPSCDAKSMRMFDDHCQFLNAMAMLRYNYLSKQQNDFNRLDAKY